MSSQTFNSFRNKIRNYASLHLCPMAPPLCWFYHVQCTYAASHHRGGGWTGSIPFFGCLHFMLCLFSLQVQAMFRGTVHNIHQIWVYWQLFQFAMNTIKDVIHTFKQQRKNSGKVWKRHISSYSIYRRNFLPSFLGLSKSSLRCLGPILDSWALVQPHECQWKWG